MSGERDYLRLLHKVIDRGDRREGRNGFTRSLFAEQIHFDLASGFPLLTTKKVHLRSIIVELLWFLRGDTNVKFLHDHNVTIWDEWADEAGDLGPVYGRQWRSWAAPAAPDGHPCWEPGDLVLIDQIAEVIEGLKRDPYSRRHIVSAWNPADVPSMALPPCHCLFQFHVSQGRLNCQLYQRSADLFLGVPFNIASYALLTMMVAKIVGLEPGELTLTFGDVHLYENHLEQALTQLSRAPTKPPLMFIADRESIDDFQLGDFTLRMYQPYGALPAEVSK